MSNYQVIVGNIGTVYEGNNGFTANQEYNSYVGISRRGTGRAGNEPVTMMKDGDIHKEHSTDQEGVIMSCQEIRIMELEKLLKRAADSLQEMTEELDGDMNNALAMEIYETLKR